MKLVVTGHTGLIGRYVTKRLKGRHEIVGISRSGDGLRVDVSRYEELSQVITEVKDADVVIHLAAYRPVVRTGRKDCFYENFRINVQGTLNVLRMAIEAGIKKFIFTSSKAVYGHNRGLVDEDDEPKPDSNYGRSKLMAEKICEGVSETYGVDCTVLRISSAFGPGMSCSLVFSIFLNRALRNQKITVHKHRSGFEVLDLIYVKDVAEAIEKAILYRGGYDVFNVGGGHVDVYELAKTIKEVVNSSAEIEVKEDVEDKRGTFLSIQKARNVLGWEPRYDLKSAIEDMLYEWHCEEYRK